MFVATVVEQAQMDQTVDVNRAQHCQAIEVLGGERGMGCSEAGRCHQVHLCLAQAARDQRRVLVTQVAHTQGHINAFGDQVDPAIE
ncbi:hypothetical protein D3C85_1696570 [compost metagenome]